MWGEGRGDEGDGFRGETLRMGFRIWWHDGRVYEAGWGMYGGLAWGGLGWDV